MNSFVDFKFCRDFFADKRVVIVGSGPGAVLNPLGFVDSHDIVLRVNNYGRHPNLGERCDVFYSFFGGSIKKTREELIADGVQLCMAKCPDGKPIESRWHEKHGRQKGIDFRYIYEARRNFWFGPTFVPNAEHFLGGFQLLENHIPTTGFSAILDVVECAPASVFLTGFDFFSSGVHNLNQRWRPGDQADPIGHVPWKEARVLAGMMKSKQIPIYADPALRQALALAGHRDDHEG